MVFTNIIVASSNLIAVYFVLISETSGTTNNSFIYVPMIASFIYHLAETKHNLPGIYPLNLYAYKLLWVDRICAVLSAAYVTISIYSYPKIMTAKFLLIGIFGLGSLLYSERDFLKGFVVNKTEFVISHTIWHFAAFFCLSCVLGPR